MARTGSQDIAVVGMAGRFPGGPDLASFWRLLTERLDPVGPVPPDRWDASAQLDPEKHVQTEGGFLSDVDQFDPAFFGISPREAEDIDPQHRIMLEVSWQALEDSGQRASTLAGSRTGVYIGANSRDYEIMRKEYGAHPTQHSVAGSALDMIASRVSYFFRLTGPSLVVQTGCSSSLVAVHLAAQALRQGEIDAALVGGVNLMLTPDVTVGLTYFGGLSPDARSKAFAASANGFVRGEGAIALWLKRLDTALAEQDRVHGVIVRTAANNDGGGESLVTPNPAGQRDLLRQIYGDGTVPLDQLRYVEAHGTGTPRGDPIEATAIGQVLGNRRAAASGPLWIGSVKSNIGHLEPAAGLAGLVKVLLAIKHGIVPATLHAEVLNPEIPFAELNLRVAREPLPLPRDEPCYLAVNSFGWGGTNAHAVVTSGPPPGRDGHDEPTDSRLPLLVPLSAHQEDALQQRAADIRSTLAAAPATLSQLAGTLAWRRDHFLARAAFVSSSAAQLRAQLELFAAGSRQEIPGAVTGKARPKGRVAFVFPGQGSQWAGMGRELYERSPVFGAAIRRCASALEPHVAWNLADVIEHGIGDESLARIDMLQPALWAVSVGLAELWRSAGVEPDVVIGHSQGEVAAATVAGVLSYADAALIIARRSEVLRRVAGRGLMLAVDLDVKRVDEVLAGYTRSVSLAVSNGPTSCVLSGDTEAVLALKETLETQGVFCRLVKVDYASHSPQMDTITGELLTALRPVRPGQGRMPLMSTMLADILSGHEMDASYWTDNLRRPVLFADAMGRLLREGVTHAVEVSAHPLLVPAIEQLTAATADPAAVLPTLHRDAGTADDMTLALARAYVSGLEPFGGLPADAAAELPGYPWQRRRFWVPPGRRRAAAVTGLALSFTPAIEDPGTWHAALDLDPDDHPWLSGHRVHGRVVMPAAAMLSLALSAAAGRTGTIPGALSGFRIHQGLAFDDEPIKVSVLWRDDMPDYASFTLLSLTPDATDWTEHATARVEWRLPSDAKRPEYPAQLRGAPASEAEVFYPEWAARGLGYEPACQGLVRTFTDGDTVLGEVRLSDRCRAGTHPANFHPALLDSALQVALAMYDGPEPIVPTAVGRVVVFRNPAEPVSAAWSHAVRLDDKHFDVCLFDLKEEPLLLFERVAVEPLLQHRDCEVDPDQVYRVKFSQKPTMAACGEPGRWLVCGTDDARVGALGGALAATGADVTLVRPPSVDDARGPEPWTDRVLAAGPLDGVAFLAPTAGEGLSRQQRGLVALTSVVRACAARPDRPRLAVVTADAQDLTVEDRPDPGGALYWGFTRVLRHEHGALRPSVIDVTCHDGSWAVGCAAELVAGEPEDEVVLRAGRRFAGRLVRGGLTAPPGRPTPAWTTKVQPFRLRAGRPGFWEELGHYPLSRRRPGPGEVEIEISAAALNFIDVMKALGTFPGQGAGASLLGIECAGRVSAVGPGVTVFAEGDRVVSCAHGALASHVTVRADHVHQVPDGWADTGAVTLPAALSTAWYGLNDLARLAVGETVLIHSAAGGLGLAAVQVAKLLGAGIVATAGNERKRDYLRGLGVAHVFNSRDSSWAEGVHTVTGGRGVDVVLNSLAGGAIALGLDALAEGGRFIEVGKNDIYHGRRISMAAFRKCVSLTAVDLAGLMDRHPERFRQLFATAWALVATGKIAALPVTVHEFADAAEVLRTMSLGDHIGKLVVTNPASVRAVAPEPMPAGRFRPDGTYLVTGGLGALGLSLAEFLVARGAGAIALLGRTAPRAAAAERIDALQAGGTRVEAYVVDVASQPALSAAMNRLRADLPPLRGVFHLAGLLDDATIASLSLEQVERVLAPKVAGARNLEEATAGDLLDLFVLFSSVAALFGTMGQAAYAAANSYMDTLARARRRRGLPALSVQWGPFSGIGLAAQDAGRGERLAAQGLSGHSAAEAWHSLTAFLTADEPVIAYAALNLPKWISTYPELKAQPSWRLLTDAAAEHLPDATSGDYLRQLGELSEDARRDLIEARVRELVGQVLRRDPQSIERETPFKALGLDSLLGLEVRNRLEAAFGLKLPPALLWTHGNTRDLAAALGAMLTPAGPPDLG